VAYKQGIARALAAVVGSFLLSTVTHAENVRTASFEAIGDVTRAPSGWNQFCSDWPSECATGKLEPRDIVLSSSTWKTLQQINRSVNREIKAVTDKVNYGRTEYWTYPQDERGDCEDILLLKRRRLVEAGYPVQALLITVVADSKGEGHAVLTVRTDRGEFILDNLRKDILPWSETGYRFVKRQSQDNPNVWVSLGSESPGAVAAAK
jgi:predicted transglutaminase-like cysteine proteinase